MPRPHVRPPRRPFVRSEADRGLLRSPTANRRGMPRSPSSPAPNDCTRTRRRARPAGSRPDDVTRSSARRAAALRRRRPPTAPGGRARAGNPSSPTAWSTPGPAARPHPRRRRPLRPPRRRTRPPPSALRGRPRHPRAHRVTPLPPGTACRRTAVSRTNLLRARRLTRRPRPAARRDPRDQPPLRRAPAGSRPRCGASFTGWDGAGRPGRAKVAPVTGAAGPASTRGVRGRHHISYGRRRSESRRRARGPCRWTAPRTGMAGLDLQDDRSVIR